MSVLQDDAYLPLILCIRLSVYLSYLT